ncbi:MAG: hypothetical protein JW703_00090 [Candidatus Diapherotrites archaeon]|nr:hypothetical protein [Candidatus Diapherotrites archaeon]
MEKIIIALALGVILLVGFTFFFGQSKPQNIDLIPEQKPVDLNPIGEDFYASQTDSGNETPSNPVSADETPIVQSNQFEADLNKCFLKENSFEKDLCIKLLSVKYLDESLCGEINPSLKDDCIKEIAVKSDYSLCNKISVNSIKFACFYESAESIPDFELCFEIPSDANVLLRDRCLNSASKKAKKIDGCIKISGNFFEEIRLRDDCLDFFVSNLQDKTYCTNYIDLNKQDDCFNYIAKNSSDSNSCLEIKAKEKKDSCLNYLGTSLGIVSACALIKDDLLKEQCAEKSIIKAKDLNSCYEISLALGRDSCFKQKAIDSLNSEYCNLIQGDFDLKSECFKEIAVKSNNSSLCSNIISSRFDLIDSCYYEIAVETKNPDLCEFVSAGQKYLDCFYLIAFNSNEPNICNYPEKTHINNSNYLVKDLCFKKYAIGKSDIDFCQRITPSELRKACIDLNADFS